MISNTAEVQMMKKPHQRLLLRSVNGRCVRTASQEVDKHKGHFCLELESDIGLTLTPIKQNYKPAEKKHHLTKLKVGYKSFPAVNETMGKFGLRLFDLDLQHFHYIILKLQAFLTENVKELQFKKCKLPQIIQTLVESVLF